ncbi:MAG: ThuA domain-containing protein, partial [Planctomycetaceae bacterium]
LNILRKFVADGKPLVALRTTSHAFCLNQGKPAQGLAAWPEFDREVLGGHYQKDYGNSDQTLVSAAEGMAKHPILTGVRSSEFPVFGSLYHSLPLAENSAPLMFGRAQDITVKEPVAWSRQRPNGGKVFYTSLGHPQDFTLPDFRQLLRNAVYWAADLPIPKPVPSGRKATAQTGGC